jgi:hypothetical protein
MDRGEEPDDETDVILGKALRKESNTGEEDSELVPKLALNPFSMKEKLSRMNARSGTDNAFDTVMRVLLLRSFMREQENFSTVASSLGFSRCHWFRALGRTAM